MKLELKLPTAEELRMSYERDLSEAFPPMELKPLRHIVRMTRRGMYDPLCLYEEGKIVGECFLWRGRPGWMLLDYLCVTRSRRNAGFGAGLLRAMRTRFPDSVIVGETEIPEHAPDPDMAARRLAFYRRNGVAWADVEAEVFGVRYQILYWANGPRPDAEIEREYAAIYRSAFPPDKYERYVQIRRGTRREAV